MSSQGIRVLILEDDPITAQDLKEILTLRGFEVVALADSYRKAVDAFTKIQPDILLVDVKLKGSQTGIDFAKYVRNGEKNCPMVYLTANSDLNTKTEAFATDPETFLTKPFSEENVVVALELAFDKFNKKRITSTSVQSDYLFAKSGDRLFKIPLFHILYFEAEGSYTKIVLASEEYIQTGNLSSFEPRMCHKFLRVHRSFMVNKEKIESLDAHQIHLEGGVSLPIGRKFRDNVKQMMG